MQSLQSLDKEHPPAGSKRWVVNDPVAYSEAVKTGNWVQTPDGLSYNTCIYHTPNNGFIEPNEIVSPSGSVQHITPCGHPILTNGTSVTGVTGHRAGQASPSTTVPGAGPCAFGPGGHYWAASCFGTDPSWMDTMTQEYAVPSNPSKTGALIFIWGGIEDQNGDTLLQDVLTWGANGNIVKQDNIWYVTNWYLWGNNSVVSPSMHVNPVDAIVASLVASKCSSDGKCTWLMKSVDKNSGRTVTYTVGSQVSFDLLMGSVLEIPSDNGCDETPSNGHAAFRDLFVDGNHGIIGPIFGTSLPDPQCSVSIDQKPTASDILWKP
jgi:hypothetical protein